MPPPRKSVLLGLCWCRRGVRQSARLNGVRVSRTVHSSAIGSNIYQNIRKNNDSQKYKNTKNKNLPNTNFTKFSKVTKNELCNLYKLQNTNLFIWKLFVFSNILFCSKVFWVCWCFCKGNCNF